MSWHIGWGLTQSCNLNCIHCYNASGVSHKDEMTFAEAKDVVDLLAWNNIRTINYGTGESALLPYFWDIVEYVHQKNIVQGLTTNGFSVNNDTIKMVKKYMNDVDVSLDFPYKEDHNKFRQHPKSWEWAVNALELLKEHGVSFSIVTCISALNVDEKVLDDFLALCRKYGCEWRINWYRPTGRGRSNDFLKLNPKDVYRVVKYILKRASLVALPDPLFAALLGIKKSVGCPCGKSSFRITPTGKIVPCVYLTNEEHILSARNAEFEKIVHSPLFHSINNRKIDFCRDCEYFDVCRGGCASRAFLEHGTMDAPDAYCYKNAGMDYNPLKGIEFRQVSKEMKVHEEYLCTMIVEP